MLGTSPPPVPGAGRRPDGVLPPLSVGEMSLAFVGFVVVFSSLKSLVMADWKCLKEVPMKKALVLGVRSVLETLWTIGTNCATAALPG